MLHSLKKEEFEEWVQMCIAERKKKVEKERNEAVTMVTEFAERLKETRLLDTVSTLFFTNSLRVMVGAPTSCVSAARSGALRSRSWPNDVMAYL